MSASDPAEVPGTPEPSPLDGWSVVVTRPIQQAGTLIDPLEHHGARVLAVPTIAIEPPDDGGVRLREAAKYVSEFDWIVFTSENAVDRLLHAVGEARDLGAARVAAIGEGTADALLRHGVVADLVPQQYVAEALVDAFPSGHRNGRVLLPRAAVARDVVPEGIRRLGWEVEVVPAYKTVPAEIAATALERVRLADAITFTSSSTVVGFLEQAAVSDLPPVVASIGPITSATARGAGVDVSVESEVHTSTGLAEALAKFARANGHSGRACEPPS